MTCRRYSRTQVLTRESLGQTEAKGRYGAEGDSGAGIDPGSRVTGIGVVEAQGQTLKHIHSESVRLGSGPLATRLVAIYERIQEIVQVHEPQVGAIESNFSHPIPICFGAGAKPRQVLTALAQKDLETSEYSALEIKRAETGTGRASKEQVQHMVRILLGLNRRPPQDAADALACAICHLHMSQGQREGLPLASVKSRPRSRARR